MSRQKKRKAIERDNCEETKSQTENEDEEMRVIIPPHKKRKKNTCAKNKATTVQLKQKKKSKNRSTKLEHEQTAGIEIRKNKSLIDLHTDALQYVVQFLSLADRAKHIALTCKHLRAIHNTARIHHKYFGENMLRKLTLHPNAIDVAKKFRLQTLYVNPHYNMDLMSVLARKTRCLFAQEWHRDPLYFTCPNATSFYFGEGSASKMLATHEKPLSMVSFQRNYNDWETISLLSENEWKALEKCAKCISSFQLNFIINLHSDRVAVELCSKSLLNVTDLFISLRSFTPELYSGPPYCLNVLSNCYLPNLRSLEIEYWTGALYWQSLQMPNLQKLVINIVKSMPCDQTGAQKFAITHQLDDVILIMDIYNCKEILQTLQLYTKRLTVVYEDCDSVQLYDLHHLPLYEFIAATQCNLQYERLITTSYSEYQKNNLIQPNVFYGDPRAEIEQYPSVNEHERYCPKCEDDELRPYRMSQ